jgi:hypothetical protein
MGMGGGGWAREVGGVVRAAARGMGIGRRRDKGSAAAGKVPVGAV